MSVFSDESKKNYSFNMFKSLPQTSGVTPETVHDMVTKLDSFKHKLQQIMKQPNLEEKKLNFDANQEAISILETCISHMDQQLQEKINVSTPHP